MPLSLVQLTLPTFDEIFLALPNRKAKLRLHDAYFWLRFYLNSLIHILSLSNSHNNVASVQKNQGDTSHHVIVALQSKKLHKSQTTLGLPSFAQ